MQRPKPVSTYLNDHLAGSAGAIDLLSALRGHSRTGELRADLDAVTTEIKEDRDALLDVMERLGVTVGTVKQAGARVGEKLMRVKSSNVVTGDQDLSRLLELEALCVGIAGKKAGWLALQATSNSSLAGVGFDRLIARADHQRDRLEPHRLQAAATTLGE